MKFKIGDRVRKRPNAGFVGVPMECVIPDVPENREDVPGCMICDDPECNEWPTIWGTGPDEGGVAYHVSDCQLEVLP